ncbi:MAG: rhodanese-like domain-containing protein [Anaerolineae bacterium]|nr:rhodanese-like domain-containing protein [Anaerolineae bacterium]
MKKFALLNLVLVLALLLPGMVLAQEPEGDFGVIQRTASSFLAGWSPVISADDLYDNLNDGDTSNDPFVVSVRSAEHYALGHIPGAINIPWKEIAKEENLAKLPTDRQIVTYCYTGHTGQVAATILGLLGYDVVNLKYGMMGWTKNDEVLATKRFGPDTDQRDYPVETEANEATETYDYPELEVGGADAQETIRLRAEEFLADWSPTTAADDLFDILNDGDDSNDPVIVSARSAEDYAKGHVPGAINIPWKQIAEPENLAKLPPDEPIVTYCYTGHTGQVTAVVLGMLGYDVTNLKYGMMGWSEDADVVATAIYDVETAPDYAVEGTAAAAAAPAATEPAAPETVPETGGAGLPLEAVLVGLGTLAAAAGTFLQRRKAA